MATRLTYTSGSIDSATHAEFERNLRKARAATGMEPHPHSIGGRPRAEGPVFERRDPSNIVCVASRAHAADPQTVAAALAAAAAAPAWRRTPYRERLQRLAATARMLSARHLELAAAVSLETGKSRLEAIGEVQETVELIHTYSEEMERHDGFVQPLSSITSAECSTESLRPYGVFGVIAPFNFPLALTTGMTAAALIAGNTVVVKPSEETPSTGALLGEAFLAGELPSGVFNLVHGGPATGRALVASPVAGIAFTGSAEVGREIARRMLDGAYARPALTEMGGKNPAIVTAAANLDRAAEGIARAAFGLSGQKCSACSRAIVLDTVHDALVERLCAFAATLPVGDPIARDTFLGPLVNAAALRRFEESVALARRDGRIVRGGARPSDGGWFAEPTIVTGLPPGHPLTRRELFLPFLTVTRAATLQEAIAEANAADYGLTAGIFSDDPSEVERFLDEIQAGVLYANRRAGATTGAWPRMQSFCGWKASGHTGKGGLGPYYLPQFMREQSRTIEDV